MAIYGMLFHQNLSLLLTHFDSPSSSWSILINLIEGTPLSCLRAHPYFWAIRWSNKAHAMHSEGPSNGPCRFSKLSGTPSSNMFTHFPEGNSSATAPWPRWQVADVHSIWVGLWRRRNWCTAWHVFWGDSFRHSGEPVGARNWAVFKTSGWLMSIGNYTIHYYPIYIYIYTNICIYIYIQIYICIYIYGD